MLYRSPWYKKFRGTITKVDERYVVSGEVATLSEDKIEITELPVRVWTHNYRESVLDPMLEGTSDRANILDFKEYHTEETVKFVVRLTPERLRQFEQIGLHNHFKLQTTISLSSMVLFDALGCLRRFDTPEQILEEHYYTRKNKYIERKAWLEGMLTAQSDRLSEQARFILMKIRGEIVLEKKKKSAIIEQLIKHNFKPDPVKLWKEQQKRRDLEQHGEYLVL